LIEGIVASPVLAGSRLELVLSADMPNRGVAAAGRDDQVGKGLGQQDWDKIEDVVPQFRSFNRRSSIMLERSIEIL